MGHERTIKERQLKSARFGSDFVVDAGRSRKQALVAVRLHNLLNLNALRDLCTKMYSSSIPEYKKLFSPLKWSAICIFLHLKTIHGAGKRLMATKKDNIVVDLLTRIFHGEISLRESSEQQSLANSLERPTGTVIYSDKISNGPNRNAVFHDSGWNCLFADGQVKFVRMSESYLERHQYLVDLFVTPDVGHTCDDEWYLRGLEMLLNEALSADAK